MGRAHAIVRHMYTFLRSPRSFDPGFRAHKKDPVSSCLEALCDVPPFSFTPTMLASSLLQTLALASSSMGLVIDHELLSRDTALPSSADLVDVFFGTTGGGNVFPGPSRPFGFVKMGVDVVGASSGDAYSGYATDGNIFGISMMHESGTGGAPEYGVVSQLAFVGAVDVSKDVSQTRASGLADGGQVGQYTTYLNNGVNVTFAAGDRAGFYDYSFPGTGDSNVIVNLTHHLIAPSRLYWTQYFVNGSVECSDDYKSYSGYSTITGGWGDQLPWTIYFYGEFEQTAASVSSFDGTTTANSTSASTSTEDQQAGLIFNFGSSTKVRSRVGISFLSTDQAKENLNADSSKYDYSIDSVTADTVSLWNTEIFDAVTVSQENSTRVNLLYTCLYGTNLLPSNRTGENPKWNTGEPYYDDWFTIWDIFRSTIPLYHALNPTRATELIRTLIDIYRHDGYMPDGRSANQNGRTQGGSNADIVLADAFLKGISNGVSWEDGLAAMIKDAEVTPPYRYDSFAPDASTFEGRGGLSDWHGLGYVSTNYTRCVTRTMEFAYDDYALFVVASGLGQDDLAEKYLNRSAQWQNIWNGEMTLTGKSYSGFVQPKDENGAWVTDDYSPDSCGGCYWGDYEYEASPIEYGWAVPHDMETLKAYIGNDSTFSERLDDMFKLHGSGYANIGNEPSFMTPYLYNFVNNSTRSAETVRYLMENNFGVGASGLPGNSDAGAMQSWMFWAMMGLYPMTGTTTYLLSAPMFENVKLFVSNGNYLYIIGENVSRSSEYVYVQSVEVNGVQWDKNWVTHEDIFAHGGVLKFVMGTEPVQWESGDLPPSPGHLNLGVV